MLDNEKSKKFHPETQKENEAQPGRLHETLTKGITNNNSDGYIRVQATMQGYTSPNNDNININAEA